MRARIFIKSKKGGDKILSLYWFAVLFIVAAGIVYMAILFYGKPYDVREVEANLLLSKISDCFVEENYFARAQDFSNPLFKDGFLEFCKINFAVEDKHGWEDDQFLIWVRVYEFDEQSPDSIGGPLLFTVEEGNPNLYECYSELNNFPFCIQRRFFSVDKNNNQYVVDMFASVRKTEKNVS